MIYLTYFVMGWGFRAICISTAVMFSTRFFVNFGLIEYYGKFPKYDDIKLFSRQTTEGYEAQLKLGMESISMGVWGWWAFDIFTLIASYLAVTIVASQTILRSIGLITFMLPVGIASSCNTLVGNSVGEGRSDTAILYYKTCMYLCLILAVGQVLFLVTL